MEEIAYSAEQIGSKIKRIKNGNSTDVIYI
jgi:hypothetical protein